VTEPDYRGISLWFDTLAEPVVPRAARNDVHGGYRLGSYYLAPARVRIAILESEVAGFGASGRNGGWCIGLLAGIEGLLARPERRAAGVALQRAAFDAVDEVGRVAAAEGSTATPQGRPVTSRWIGAAPLAGVHRQLASRLAPTTRWLEPAECEARVRMSGRWAACMPNAARCTRRGWRAGSRPTSSGSACIFERTRVERLEFCRAHCPRRAARRRDRPGHRGLHRGAARPPQSAAADALLMIAPAPRLVWKEIGPRTPRRRRRAYHRVAQRGQPAHVRGCGPTATAPAFCVTSRDAPELRRAERILHELLPPLRGARITHRWGGALAVPRDLRARVGIDRERGLAWIGGYFGEGVAASNLAGRTLAELIRGVEDRAHGLPLVAPPARAWGRAVARARSALALGLSAAQDRASARGGAPTWRDRLLSRIMGR
jgi:glycine/D-amino acid oxidase-like deaminating enzyme